MDRKEIKTQLATPTPTRAFFLGKHCNEDNNKRTLAGLKQNCDELNIYSQKKEKERNEIKKKTMEEKERMEKLIKKRNQMRNEMITRGEIKYQDKSDLSKRKIIDIEIDEEFKKYNKQQAEIKLLETYITTVNKNKDTILQKYIDIEELEKKQEQEEIELLEKYLTTVNINKESLLKRYIEPEEENIRKKIKY